MTPPKRTILWLCLSVLAAGSMAFYVFNIWGANQPPHFSDFYARWWGAHELLLHGRNPYSPEVSREIQTVIYGEAVTPSPDDPAGIAGGFAYPPHTALLLWPLIYGSFPAAERVVLGLSMALTLLSMLLWLSAFRMRLTALQWTTFGLLVFGSFPALQGLKLLNPSLIAAGFIAIAVYFLFADQLVPAGIFLAISTFKPQFVIVLIPWLALWGFARIRLRWRFALSFLATMLLLLLASERLLPSGLLDFLTVARAYQHYTHFYSLFGIWFPARLATVASAALLASTIWLTWRALMAPARSPLFVASVSLLLAATVVVIPTIAPHVQMLLLPGLILLTHDRNSIWRSGPKGRISLVAAGVMLVWPWIAAFGLMVASLWLRGPSLLRLWQVPLYASPVLPLAVFLALAFRIRSQSAERLGTESVSPITP